MTPADKRERWPFLAEDKVVHVSADGERTVIEEATLEPSRKYRRMNITADLPKEAYTNRAS